VGGRGKRGLPIGQIRMNARPFPLLFGDLTPIQGNYRCQLLPINLFYGNLGLVHLYSRLSTASPYKTF
jgi:hypothetical protein